MAAAIAAAVPPFYASSKQKNAKRSVLRWDGKFLRSARRAVNDIFWLRNLEDPSRALHQTHPTSSWPNISYAPGLSTMDLLMADLEAVKVYTNYLQHASQIWSMPLPGDYDAQKVVNYFSCRPHVTAFRIFEVFLSFASVAIKLQTLRIFKFDRGGMDKDNSSDSSSDYVGQLLKESLLNLGPTFVKVGQSLSTRPDIIGSEISKALSELHDKVPPFPRGIAIHIIEEEFGCPVENIFSYISEEPVAAASFGQVYRGCTLDGCVVAVKIQRPDLLPAVMRDIYILRLGMAILRKVANRKNDLCLYADELGKGLVGELDYNMEAANASEFMEAHSKYSFMSIPKVFRHLTRKRVLTMDWMIGENPNDLLLLSKGPSHGSSVYPQRQQLEAKTRLLDFVNKGVEAALVQLLETGLLHADPHPGNLCYTPDRRIGFYDFGLLCRMEKRHQHAMLASMMHIINGDWGALVHDLTLMDVARPGTNLRRVTMDMEDALGEVVFENGIPNIKFSKVFGKIWSVALKYHFRMPPYYTLVLRSLASFEGLALAADQDFKTFQAAYPYVIQYLLNDNSVATRQILYSVALNKKRELQWKKILHFCRIKMSRKAAIGRGMLNTKGSPVYRRNGDEEIFEIASPVLRLLLSKDGYVLRRLLMTADGASLTRPMVSEDAAPYRQQASRAFADMIYQSMVRVESSNQSEHGSGAKEEEVFLQYELQSVMRDRRFKVIFYKVLRDTRRDRVLMLRVCWNVLAIFATASAIALHRLLLRWSDRCIRSLSSVHRQFALSVR